MRIVQVLPHRQLGGMQEVSYDLHRDLESRGHLITTLALADLAPASGLRVVRAMVLTTRVWRELRGSRADAVVAHAPMTAVLALLLAALLRVPHRVLVMHTVRAGASAHALRLLFAGASARAVTRVVHVGPAVLDSFADAPRAFLAVSVVIRNVVRVRAPRHQSYRTAPPYRLLSVGRLIPAKNVALLVELAGVLGEEGVLVFCGSGPEEELLRRRAAAIDARVEFRGQLSREDVWQEYEQADLLLFPSRDEGMPMVLLEAQAAGVPVVASDIPANQDALGSVAVYCSTDTVEEWRERVVGLLTSPAERRRLVEDGRVRAASAEVDGGPAAWEAILRS